MHFRSQRKSSQDVSLSDYIETGSDGAELSLMEVISSDDDLTEILSTKESVARVRRAVKECLTLSTKESVARVRRAVKECLTGQEQQVIVMRYGLDGASPKRQREVALATGISRSYVSRIEKRALAKLRGILEK